MAKIEAIVPHILQWEVGLKDSEKKLPPEKMYEAVASRGYHCIKGDAGGHTMCGVTFRTLKEYCQRFGYNAPSLEDLKNLSFEEWKSILEFLFWRAVGANNINNESIAIMIADWMWVNGTQAIRDMQTALGLVPDGIVGPKTIAKINDYIPQIELFNRIKAARIQSYNRIVARRPNQKKFLKGWINRVESIEFKQQSI